MHQIQKEVNGSAMVQNLKIIVYAKTMLSAKI